MRRYDRRADRVHARDILADAGQRSAERRMDEGAHDQPARGTARPGSRDTRSCRTYRTGRGRRSATPACPASPSAPPVMRAAPCWRARSSIAATTSVSISSVRPGVRRMMAPETRPTSAARRRGGEQAGIGSPQPLAREHARGIGADAEERGVAQRDDAGIAEHEIDRQREQDDGQDLRAEREIVGKHEEGGDRRDPGQRLERIAGGAGARSLQIAAVGIGGMRRHACPNRPRGRHSRIAMVSA